MRCLFSIARLISPCSSSDTMLMARRCSRKCPVARDSNRRTTPRKRIHPLPRPPVEQVGFVGDHDVQPVAQQERPADTTPNTICCVDE